jgi:hypothetical protein
MSPVDKEVTSYFLTNLEDRVPFPAPGFPNMTILNTFPSLPVFPDSSFTLVALRNRVREGTVGGIDPLSLNAAGPQCLDDHCRGEMSIGKGKREKERGERAVEGRSLKVGPLRIYTGKYAIQQIFNGNWGIPKVKAAELIAAKTRGRLIVDPTKLRHISSSVQIRMERTPPAQQVSHLSYAIYPSDIISLDVNRCRNRFTNVIYVNRWDRQRICHSVKRWGKRR